MTQGKDIGAIPLPDGRFEMLPSGAVVDLAERNRRLGIRVKLRGRRAMGLEGSSGGVQR